MKHREISLQELLKDFTAQKHLKDKLLDKKLEELWKNLYHNMAKYTSKVQFKKGCLLVWISSAPLRQELMYKKDVIIKQLNEELKEALIVQIEFR
jgi:hypothetical protein